MTKKITTILLSISIIPFFGCTSKDTKEKNSDFETIKLTEYEEFNNTLLSANEIALSDSGLFVYSKQGESDIIHVLSPNGELIASGIGFGNGPDEVLEVASLHPIQKDMALYDGKKGKIYKLSVNGKDIELEEVANSQFLHDDAVVLPNKLILTLPVNRPYSYSLTDAEGSMVDSISYFPPKPEGIDDNTHRLACTGHMAISPNGENMVRAVAYDGGVDFFSLKDGKIKHKKRYSKFNMEYGALEGKISVPIPTDESRTGYSFLYATDKHFYASFSDLKALDNPGGECLEIHVFDMDGNPEYKLILDKSFTTFAVDKKEENLYISSSDDEENTIIYKYKIPKLN